MKISSFMDAVKSPELAKRFSNKVPATVNEMMERLDDFVRSKAYANTELPKGETRETHRKAPLPFNRRDSRLFCNTHPGDSRRSDYRNSYRGRDAYPTNRTRDYRAPYPQPRGEYHNRVAPVLTLDSLTKRPKEILATETQLRLPTPRPMLNPLKNGAGIKEVGSPSESRTTNRKGVPRQGCSPTSKDNQCDQSSEDISDEPLIVEAEVEGYLVRRIYVDEGSSVVVMFEHCEVSKPLGKIELEVCLGNGGLCRRTSMKFIVVRAPSPYNIILGRPRLKTLPAIPSTILSMMKFLTPKGMATLVNRTVIIVECRVEEGKFLGYMVTSEGIRTNPKKTKALANLQSPRTLKEMQSLSEKLASLNRFLAKSTERSLPFFNTLKNITKENKHEYQ
ncbi:hypothetical protein Tco_1001277 [Tanacetum coccineum]